MVNEGITVETLNYEKNIEKWLEGFTLLRQVYGSVNYICHQPISIDRLKPLVKEASSELGRQARRKTLMEDGCDTKTKGKKKKVQIFDDLDAQMDTS